MIGTYGTLVRVYPTGTTRERVLVDVCPDASGTAPVVLLRHHRLVAKISDAGYPVASLVQVVDPSRPPERAEHGLDGVWRVASEVPGGPAGVVEWDV